MIEVEKEGKRKTKKERPVDIKEKKAKKKDVIGRGERQPRQDPAVKRKLSAFSGMFVGGGRVWE